MYNIKQNKYRGSLWLQAKFMQQFGGMEETGERLAGTGLSAAPFHKERKVVVQENPLKINFRKARRTGAVSIRRIHEDSL